MAVRKGQIHKAISFEHLQKDEIVISGVLDIVAESFRDQADIDVCSVPIIRAPDEWMFGEVIV